MNPLYLIRKGPQGAKNPSADVAKDARHGASTRARSREAPVDVDRARFLATVTTVRARARTLAAARFRERPKYAVWLAHAQRLDALAQARNEIASLKARLAGTRALNAQRDDEQ